jgi:hypothetical protein
MLKNMTTEERMNIAGALKRIIRKMEENWTSNPKEIGRLIGNKISKQNITSKL